MRLKSFSIPTLSYNNILKIYNYNSTCFRVMQWYKVELKIHGFSDLQYGVI